MLYHIFYLKGINGQSDGACLNPLYSAGFGGLFWLFFWFYAFYCLPVLYAVFTGVYIVLHGGMCYRALCLAVLIACFVVFTGIVAVYSRMPYIVYVIAVVYLYNRIIIDLYGLYVWIALLLLLLRVYIGFLSSHIKGLGQNPIF